MMIAHESGKAGPNSVLQLCLGDIEIGFGYLLNHATHIKIHRFAVKGGRETNVGITTSPLPLHKRLIQTLSYCCFRFVITVAHPSLYFVSFFAIFKVRSVAAFWNWG